MDISIIELGDLDMLISYNQLDTHNPAINQRIKTILRREPVHKVARVRRETRPTNQSSPQDRRFGKISPYKIRRIYKKDPQKVGVIQIRRVATTKEGPLLLEILREYQTNKFKELFKENKAIDLVDYQDQDYKIILDKGAKLSLGLMYLVAPKYDAKLQDYIQKNLKKGFI